MKRQSKRRYSIDEYFAVEETSKTKNEYYDGEIFAMAGASINHNRIVVNILGAVSSALRNTGCEVFGSDLRIQTPGGLFTYPDVALVCGKPLLIQGRPDTVTNPIVLFEVLSDATREYDREDKFRLYKEIPTLREYVLVEQSLPSVERFFLEANGAWNRESYEALDRNVVLAAVKLSISLQQIYLNVF